MELLKRYLNAVGFWLPKEQREDILAELGENLRSRIDDQEAVLGHPLDEDGVAVILLQRGHPMLVAGGFLPQRSLIGPALFPAYQFILKLVILWILIPVFILVVGPATILSGRNPSLALLSTAWTLVMAAVFAFGVITLIFAALEKYPHESMLRFDPRRLPPAPPARAANAPQPVPRFTPIVEMLAGIVVSLCWIDVLWLRTSFNIHGVEIALAPVWRTFFWVVLLVTFSGVPIGLMGWLRPWWGRARSFARLSVNGVTLVLIGALVNMGPWVTVTAQHLPAASLAEANHWTNVGISIGLAAMSLITLVDGIQEVLRLVRRRPSSSATSLAVRR